MNPAPPSVLKRILLFYITTVLTGCTGVLPGLMVKRLNWMDEVAQNKLAHSLPVINEKREAELMKSMIARGTESGLPTLAVEEFFKGQILAARAYQEEWLSLHSTAAPFSTEALDLNKTVRPALDTLGEEMIHGLVKDRESKRRERILASARLKLQKAGYSEEVRAFEMKGLRAGLMLE